jgi:DNA-binding XRE family transcriptional regulator
MEEGKIPASETDEASMKRRKIAETLDSSANVLVGKEKDSMLPEIKTISSSQQISVDDTWQEQGIITVTVINRSVFGVNNALV